MGGISRREWVTGTGERRAAWIYRYRDRSGKQRSAQFTLKREAEAERARIEGELVAGVHTPTGGSITVAEVTALWLANAKRIGNAAGTLRQKAQHKALHIDPHLGSVRIASLNGPMVQEFVDRLLERSNKPTAAKVLRSLRHAISVARARGKVATNAAEGITIAVSRRDKKQATPPPRAHIRGMFEAAARLAPTHPGIDVMVMLAAFTGLRQGELRALAWDDIDLAAGTVSVSRAADRLCDIHVPKSEAAHRTIPIGPALVARLGKWRLACPGSNLNLVFPNRHGGVLKQHRILDLLGFVQLEAGLARAGQGGKIAKAYRWHDFRHAAASNWIRQRADLKRIQTWLGHASVSLTVDVYGHLLHDSDADRASAAAIEASILDGGE